MNDETWMDPEELKKANDRCDADLRRIRIDVHGNLGRIRSGWSSGSFMMKGSLTDKKISQYAKDGFYSEDFREFRKKKMLKKAVRSGNFVEVNGQLLYSPLGGTR